MNFKPMLENSENLGMLEVSNSENRENESDKEHEEEVEVGNKDNEENKVDKDSTSKGMVFAPDLT